MSGLADETSTLMAGPDIDRRTSHCGGGRRWTSVDVGGRNWRPLGAVCSPRLQYLPLGATQRDTHVSRGLNLEPKEAALCWPLTAGLLCRLLYNLHSGGQFGAAGRGGGCRSGGGRRTVRPRR